MNVTQAMTKLRKLLGPKAGLRDSKRPSSPEQREQEHRASLAATVRKREADAAMTARRQVILDADAEYQQLKAEYKAACAVRDQTGHGLYHRYTAGTLSSMFFVVKAEADTLDELVAKVAQKEAA